MSHNTRTHRVRQFKPIPKVRTRFWYPFQRISDDIQRGFERHGDIVQLRGFLLRVFCLRDPVHIEQVLKDPKVGTRKLPSVFPRLKSMMPHSTVVVSGGNEWRKCQEVMSKMFAAEYMDCYAAITTELTYRMLDERWQCLANDETPFDMYEELQFLLTRIAFRILFSERVTEPSVIDISRKCSFLESHFPKRLPPILPTATDTRYRRHLRELRGLMLSLLRKRVASGQREQDLLQILVDRRESFDDNWIVDHMVETWNSVRLINPPMGLALRLIVQHADVQHKLIHELRTNQTSSDVDSTNAYLNMVLAEVCRFYPSQLFLPRWCEDGIPVGDYHIPKNSLVAPMILHTHRNPNIYPNPSEFDPERWNTERQKDVPSHARLAFGAGPRGCLGVKLAKDIMRTIIRAVFMKYRLSPGTTTETDARNVELSVHPREPMIMRIRCFSNEVDDLHGQDFESRHSILCER